jgi:hypothetical protein
VDTCPFSDAELLDRAAAALEQAKMAGGNCVIFAQGTRRPQVVEGRSRTSWLRVVKRYEDVETKEAG